MNSAPRSCVTKRLGESRNLAIQPRAGVRKPSPTSPEQLLPCFDLLYRLRSYRKFSALFWPRVNNRNRKRFNVRIIFLVNADLCEQDVLMKRNLSLQNKNPVRGKVRPVPLEITSSHIKPKRGWEQLRKGQD